MTAQLSRERLEEIIGVINAGAYGYSVSAEEIGAMARMLPAGMESEPVVYIGKQMLESLCDEGGRTCGRVWHSDTDELSRESRIPLYAAPPAPVAVPDDVVTIAERLVREYIANKGTSSEFICCITPQRSSIGTGGVWDDWKALDAALSACRAAMQAEPVTATNITRDNHEQI